MSSLDFILAREFISQFEQKNYSDYFLTNYFEKRDLNEEDFELHLMDAIIISDDEIVSVDGSDDPDDEPILAQIERLNRKRKRPDSPIIIESDDETIRPGPSRVSTDREVSPMDPIDLDKVRLPSPDSDSDDGLYDGALALRSPNPMVPGK